MKSTFRWSRLLAYAVLCVLAFAPGALHARVCLVALGALECADCCQETSCCAEEPADGPTAATEEQDCHCCLDVDLDASERTPLAPPTTRGADFTIAPAAVAFTLPAILEPPAAEQARCLFARAGPPPRPPAALLPLRI